MNKKIRMYRLTLTNERSRINERLKSIDAEESKIWKSAKDMKERIDKCSPLWREKTKLEGRLVVIGKDLLEKKYANHYMYSDIEPYEVIEERTPDLYIIRSMKCTEGDMTKLKDSFVAGGFCGHFDNSLQEWNIESDENGTIQKIRRHKDGTWRTPSGSKFSISSRPVKFYDYNF